LIAAAFRQSAPLVRGPDAHS